jgi:hypothetical protein
MSQTQNSLIERIRERAKDPVRFVDMPDVINKADFHLIPPPVSIAEMKMAETRLGFRLPSLLRMLYLQIGNGGFGPGYGLIGLAGGTKLFGLNLVELYQDGVNAGRPEPYRPWPAEYIDTCDWGCGITSALRWTDADAPVFRVHGDLYEGGPWEAVMMPEAGSLHSWLEDWLSGRPLVDPASL